jgi:hypothetical protein
VDTRQWRQCIKKNFRQECQWCTSQCIPSSRNFLYCCLKIHVTVSSTLSPHINVLSFSTLFNDTKMWKLHGIQLVLNSASHMWTVIAVSLIFVLYLAMQLLNCLKRAALHHYMIYSPEKGVLMSFWVCVIGFATWHTIFNLWCNVFFISYSSSRLYYTAEVSDSVLTKSNIQLHYLYCNSSARVKHFLRCAGNFLITSFWTDNMPHCWTFWANKYQWYRPNWKMLHSHEKIFKN